MNTLPKKAISIAILSSTVFSAYGSTLGLSNESSYSVPTNRTVGLGDEAMTTILDRVTYIKDDH